jgi:hypothetical protein
VSVIIRGLPELEKILEEVPKIGEYTITRATPKILEYGISHLKKRIEEETEGSDKSTGALAESITGDFEIRINPTVQTATIEIGSELPYAGYTVQDIGATHMHRRVFIKTNTGDTIDSGEIGVFRYIGVRPMMPKHHYLEKTERDVRKYIETMYSGVFEEVVTEIKATPKTVWTRAAEWHAGRGT